jgi:DNA-binding transcriptional LysR family regulator
VPGAWAALARSAPQVRIDLTEMEPDESLPATARGETDVAVAHEYDLVPRPLDPLFERRELVRDPVLVAVPADFPLDGPLPPGVRLLPPAEPVTRQIFTVSRRGGDRKPAVRAVLDALAAEAAAPRPAAA